MQDGSPLTFMRATAGDAAALLALERRVAIPRLYEARTSIGEVLREIAANALYLVRLDGRVVGSVSFRSVDGGGVYIGNMAVDPQHRRRGIARAAMAFVFDRTPEAVSWELVTHPDNHAAIDLYQSLGFTPQGRHENYFGDGQPRMIFVRRLAHRHTSF